MKYLIARNSGPGKDDPLSNSRLVPGHKYRVVAYSDGSSGDWITDKPLESNPREPKFYVKVLDDTGINSWSIWHTGTHTYWNDYFLSTEEMRELKLEEMGI